MCHGCREVVKTGWQANRSHLLIRAEGPNKEMWWLTYNDNTCTSGRCTSFKYSWWWPLAPETCRVTMQKYNLHSVASSWCFIWRILWCTETKLKFMLVYLTPRLTTNVSKLVLSNAPNCSLCMNCTTDGLKTFVLETALYESSRPVWWGASSLQYIHICFSESACENTSQSLLIGWSKIKRRFRLIARLECNTYVRSWTDRVRNEEVLLRVNGQRNITHEIIKRKANWIGHLLRRNCLLNKLLNEK